MKEYTAQGALTSPGKHAHAIEALPDDVTSLLAAIHGIFVHGEILKFHGFAVGFHEF